LIPADRWPWLVANLQLISSVATLMCVIAFSRFVWLDANGMIQQRRKSRKRKTRSKRQRPERSRTSPSESTRRPPTDATPAESKRDVGSTPSRVPDLGRSTSGVPGAVRSSPLRSKIDAMKSSDDADGDDLWDEDSSEGGEKSRLSKAERRRLKKLQRRQRHAA
jgi:hypothetical protein